MSIVSISSAMARTLVDAAPGGSQMASASLNMNKQLDTSVGLMRKALLMQTKLWHSHCQLATAELSYLSARDARKIGYTMFRPKRLEYHVLQFEARWY